MDSRVRRTLEMGKRALAFFEANTAPNLGSIPAVARLKELLARADQLLLQQRDGINEFRAAAGEKRDLRRKIRRTHLPHFSRVGEAAAVERPELGGRMELPNEALPYLAFRTAVQGILSEAQNQKELLLRHGLAESALQALADAAAQFEGASERVLSARRAHVGARAELGSIAEETNQQVRQLDALVRFRFAEDTEARAAWRSASNTFGPVRSGGQTDGRSGGQLNPPPSNENKPAA